MADPEVYAEALEQAVVSLLRTNLAGIITTNNAASTAQAPTPADIHIQAVDDNNQPPQARTSIRLTVDNSVDFDPSLGGSVGRTSHSLVIWLWHTGGVKHSGEQGVKQGTRRQLALLTRAVQIAVERHLRGTAGVYNYRQVANRRYSVPITGSQVAQLRELRYSVLQESYSAWGTS